MDAKPRFGFPAVAAAMLLLLACSSDDPPLSQGTVTDATFRSTASQPSSSAPVPTDLVSATYGGEAITFWPYLSPNGSTPEDPVSLVLAGTASVVEIRAALLALDGNRSGWPPLGRWSDAQGGAQAAYIDGIGWVASVIQLSLGQYGPFRVHLRLFDTGKAFGDDGRWMLIGAHMEVQIPGTPDHQVLAWERAEMLVADDLIRAGLLQNASFTGVINAEPGFRLIPPPIYNGVPDQLKQLCDLPLGPTGVPVPIPNNGHATVAGASSNGLFGEGSSQSFTVPVHQTIPKPFCMAGPADYYVIDGSIDIRKDVQITGGRLSYRSTLGGELTATPAGGGDSFKVRVHDIQNGFISADHSLVNQSTRRIAPQDGGSELQVLWLQVGEGNQQFRELEKCLTD